MNAILKTALAVATLAMAALATAQVTFYENDGFQGRSFRTEQQVINFQNHGFNDRASSAIVVGDAREVCEDAGFQGRCVILRPGRYPSLAAMGLNDRISSVRNVNRNDRYDNNRYSPAPVASQVTFYENERFGGRNFTTAQPVENFRSYGFNDRASSVVVTGDRWEVCEDTRFGGRCFVLHPGRYPSLGAMGLNDRISSARSVNSYTQLNDNRYAPVMAAAPPPTPVFARDERNNDGNYNRDNRRNGNRHDYRRRNEEQTYEASVLAVRAVVGTPEQRCWVEREQVAPERRSANVPGAVLGAVIGGILGHQVGNGRGNDLATVGGAVAGGAIGANVGRDTAQPAATQDVRRCENVPSQARPDYWDVTYSFRGQEYRVQMTSPPGNTIIVNEQGEPRE